MRADRATVERLVKTARGQMDGILRMVEDDRYCMDIVNQLTAVESILHRARREVLKAHLDGCVQESFESGSAGERAKKLDEILDLLDKCMQ